ncbi:unnamed protein product [Pieris macdunnoughi]|uniref:Uncharacterized protein n=1 Tax=Pieris macdunnoughi TaxID=345717 RepID=A0A821UC58_9NEOP|nr:unnamed protein product [Pieris macdunnoughi]
MPLLAVKEVVRVREDKRREERDPFRDLGSGEKRQTRAPTVLTAAHRHLQQEACVAGLYVIRLYLEDP